MATKCITSKEVTLTRESFGLLRLTLLEEGRVTVVPHVQVKVGFPLSDELAAVSFCNEDGEEIGVLTDAENLEESSAKALSDALSFTYFIPRITGVDEIKDEYGVTRWKVQTDRGPRTFEVQSRHDIRPVGPGRYLVRDIDGNRFEISDIASLDPASRAKLEDEL